MDLDRLRDWLKGDTAAVVAQVLMILLVLLLTWLARRTAEHLIARLNRILTRRTRTTLDEKLILVLQPPLRFLITVLGLWIALLLLNLPLDLRQIVGHVMASLIVIALTWGAYRSVDLVVSALWTVGKRTFVPQKWRNCLVWSAIRCRDSTSRPAC